MANSKLTALTAVTTFDGDELFYVVDDDDGTPVSRKVTVEDLATGLAKFMPGGLLASKYYDPGTQADPVTSSSTYADADATNLVLPNFVVPPSGEVLIVLSCIVSCSASGSTIGFNIRDGSGDVTGTDGGVRTSASTTEATFVSYRRRKSGLTPGATITGWKWGFARTSGTGNVFMDYGGTQWPGALMEVYTV